MDAWNATCWGTQAPLPLPSACDLSLQGWLVSFGTGYILLNLPYALTHHSVLHLGWLYFYQALKCTRVCQYLIKMLLKTAFFHLFTEADYMVFELCLNWRHTHVKTVIFITHTQAIRRSSVNENHSKEITAHPFQDQLERLFQHP